MRWRLRQVTTLVGELEHALAELRSTLGLSASQQGEQTASTHGLSNAWLPIGSSMLEVGEPAHAGNAFHRFHEQFGDGGYMVVLQTDDLDAARTRLERAGVRVTWEIDEGDSRELHLDHRDVGGTILALDWADPPGMWRWAGPDWPSHVRTQVVSELLGAEISVPEPSVVAARWAEVLEREVLHDADGSCQVLLDRGHLRFRPSDAHGRGRLTAVEVAAGDGRSIGREEQLAGLQFRFVAPIEPT